jgi:hypothetical protein
VSSSPHPLRGKDIVVIECDSAQEAEQVRAFLQAHGIKAGEEAKIRFYLSSKSFPPSLEEEFRQATQNVRPT